MAQDEALRPGRGTASEMSSSHWILCSSIGVFGRYLQADRRLKLPLGMIRDDSFGPAVTVGLGGIFACSTTRRYSYRRSDGATCTVRWTACAPAFRRSAWRSSSRVQDVPAMRKTVQHPNAEHNLRRIRYWPLFGLGGAPLARLCAAEADLALARVAGGLTLPAPR
jgi:hypothetical protein